MQHKESLEFFPGFAWAVRKAFREPLASCRFEQGDILYDTKKAYEGTWNDAINHLRFSIQINSPLRGIVSNKKQDEASVFTENWRQLVELDLVEYPSKKTLLFSTTQGRLYTTLWKGDIRQLKYDSPEPPVPRLAKDALINIPSTSDMFVLKCTTGITHPILFIMPFDETNEILRIKMQNIKNNLKEFQPQTLLSDPEEFGLPNANEYVPTFKLACFVMDTIEQRGVYVKLKEALYSRSKDKRIDVDRFKLERHGYLHPEFKIISREK
jgi:hypothetical protein